MSTSKKAFDFSRNSIYVIDPLEVAIAGGTILPKDERGPLDFAVDSTHPLYDRRLEKLLTEEFIANLDTYGVIHAVVIAKINGIPVIVVGRRRIRGARVVNARRKARGDAPLNVQATLRSHDLQGVMISENEVREDDDPSVKADKLRSYLERGVDIEHAARAFGISQSLAQKLLAFDVNATDDLKKAVTSGKISTSAAMEISRARDPEKQTAALAAATTKSKPSVAAARRAVQKTTGKGKSPGVSGRKEVRVLLDAIAAKSHPNASERTMAWWDGVENALKLILGESDADARLTDIAKEVL